jgi:uncharacterized protein Yka (UPF0111/DUF47 family)
MSDADSDELFKKINNISEKLITNNNNKQSFFINHIEQLKEIFESIKTLKVELVECKKKLNPESNQSALPPPPPPQNQNPNICDEENKALKQVITDANSRLEELLNGLNDNISKADQLTNEILVNLRQSGGKPTRKKNRKSKYIRKTRRRRH